MITQWDELDGVRRERGHIAATWYPLTGDNSVTVGVRRIVVDPGMWSTPLHVEGSEEEIFYVLGGSGISVQFDGEALEAFEVGPGVCLVHLALEHAHTLQAGPDGLDVLAFGQRHYAGGVTVLPRAGIAWLGASWGRIGGEEDHPWMREAEAGPPELPALSPRPARIVDLADVPVRERRGDSVAADLRDLGRAAGSLRTGLKHVRVLPGTLAVVPHCHSAEEEIFVVLEGSGEVELLPSPAAADDGVVQSTHPVRVGSTVARPAGTGVAHTFRAGADGMELLAYGTREPNDVAYYPRSNKVFFRGVGLVARIESLDYWDGES